MSEEIREAVQIIEVAYDGIEIAMKVGSGGISAMQKAMTTNSITELVPNRICPKGIPKFTIFLSIPSCFSQVSIVVVIAADEEAVVSPIKKEGITLLINTLGFTLVVMQIIHRYTMIAKRQPININTGALYAFSKIKKLPFITML